MAKARPAIPKVTKEAVLKEFNHLCAICGKISPQIHHIDENPENNDPANLLPLCPNHHLTDQHNPTRKLEPLRLRLFREFKDPAILKPQFQPIFNRMLFLFAPLETIERGSTAEQARDLSAFIREMTCGVYYANKIDVLLKPEPGLGSMDVLDDASIRAAAERKRASYQAQINQNRSTILSLCVELLRYQNWPELAADR